MPEEPFSNGPAHFNLIKIQNKSISEIGSLVRKSNNNLD